MTGCAWELVAKNHSISLAGRVPQELQQPWLTRQTVEEPGTVVQEEKRTELHFDSVMAGGTALHQMECWGKFYFLTTCVCTQMEDCYFS